VHVSIFEYQIQDIEDAGWSQACDDLAPEFAAVPGLLSKVWLHGEGDARGGVYLWEDKAAYEAFLASDMGKAVGSHPNIAELTTRDYAVDEAPTRATRGAPTAVG
jgi:Putative mono-oxygenase ydhR